jgi:hypothetical protein
MILEVITLVIIKITAFQEVTACNLVDSYLSFRRNYCLHLQSRGVGLWDRTVLQIVCNCRPIYMKSHLKYSIL